MNTSEIVRQWYEEETKEYIKHGFFAFNAALLGDTVEEHLHNFCKLLEVDVRPVEGFMADMGAGIGAVPTYIKRHYQPDLQAFGVTNVLAQARAMLDFGAVTPLLCDYHEVPLPDNSCGLVLFNETIGYGNLVKLLREAKRLLNKSGKIFIKDYVLPSADQYFSSAWNYRLYREGDIDQVAGDLGMTVVDSREVPCNRAPFLRFVYENEIMRNRYWAKETYPEAKDWVWTLTK